MKAKSVTTRYRVIVPDVSETCFLALSSGDGWSLPGWSIDGAPAWEDASPVNAGVMETLGLRVTMLRATALDRSDTRLDGYYLVENLDPDWQPEHGARWIPKEEAWTLRWASPREADQVQAWVVDQPSPTRIPWYLPGWFDTAERWIVSTLRQAGIAPDSGVEQLRSWERCSLFRVATRDGDVYFKAVPPQWGHEPELTTYLARQYPAACPQMIACDPARGYLLLAEFGGRPLEDVDDPDDWAAAYAALGRMQRELIDHVEDLHRIGVPRHGPPDILPRIGLMLGDERRLRLAMDDGLNPTQAGLLREARERIAAACRRLMSGPIPLSLDHGDFWPGNIRWTDAGPLIFDWSDATITHPFFSLVMAADEIGTALPRLPWAGRSVIDAYLQEWTSFAPLDELRTIFADAMLVAPLHQALMYRDVYLPAMEFVDELDRMPVVYLRWLLKELARDRSGHTALR